MKMVGGRYAQVLMLFVLVSSLFAFGCAAKVAPIEDISRAEMAIKEAQESNGEMYAPLELRLAGDKLSQAKKAMAEAFPLCQPGRRVHGRASHGQAITRAHRSFI